MAVREAVATALSHPFRRKPRLTICGPCLKLQRSIAIQASAASLDAADDLVHASSLKVPSLPEDEARAYDPLKSSRNRKLQLPPSRSVSSLSGCAQLDHV